MQSDTVIAKRRAPQSPGRVTIVGVEEDRALVDASLRDVQWHALQFKARQSWQGGCW
jgi:hypothetical protein